MTTTAAADKESQGRRREPDEEDIEPFEALIADRLDARRRHTKHDEAEKRLSELENFGQPLPLGRYP